ncbi:hypothetical protein L1887_55103 [Cichorium endivia]|nr:hypothetical protein L1887_55103 [Cichorium endivia]
MAIARALAALLRSAAAGIVEHSTQPLAVEAATAGGAVRDALGERGAQITEDLVVHAECTHVVDVDLEHGRELFVRLCLCNTRAQGGELLLVHGLGLCTSVLGDGLSGLEGELGHAVLCVADGAVECERIAHPLGRDDVGDAQAALRAEARRIGLCAARHHGGGDAGELLDARRIDGVPHVAVAYDGDGAPHLGREGVDVVDDLAEAVEQRGLARTHVLGAAVDGEAFDGAGAYDLVDELDGSLLGGQQADLARDGDVGWSGSTHGLERVAQQDGGGEHVGAHARVGGEGLGAAAVEVDGGDVVGLRDDLDGLVGEIRVGAAELVHEIGAFDGVAREDLLVLLEVFDDTGGRVDLALAADDGAVDDFGTPHEVGAVLEREEARGEACRCAPWARGRCRSGR